MVVLIGLGLLSTAAWADDFDGDGVDDTVDNCPYDSNNNQIDSDCDGIGDACDDPESAEVCLGGTPPDNDFDDDGWDDGLDNCVDVPNDQADGDCDQIGDACDDIDDMLCDDDGDGVPEATDNCPDTTNVYQEDSDCDGAGDACDSVTGPMLCDSDSDGLTDDADNCPDDSNPEQENSDCDEIGDACDLDIFDPICDADGDGEPDDSDNCPDVENSNQLDDDCDGIGDVCDPDTEDGPCGVPDADADGVPDALDDCPDADATDHDLYLDGCIDTIYDFSPFIRTLEISKTSAETALTAVADSAALSAERGQPLVAQLKLRALENLAKAFNRVAFITNDQYGLIVRFSGDVGDDL